MHPEYGVLMAPHLNAQIHQHFFQVRLDMACDNEDGGKGLIVTEVCSRCCHAYSANCFDQHVLASDPPARTYQEMHC